VVVPSWRKSNPMADDRHFKIKKIAISPQLIKLPQRNLAR